MRPISLLLLLAPIGTAFNLGFVQRPQAQRATTPHLGFLDDALSAAKEQFREVTVQHVLVNSEKDAMEIYAAMLEDPDGTDPEKFGQIAAKQSICGSAKKRPNANLKLLRGNPGELKFRRGSMVKTFETKAFEAAPGTLVPPFFTSNGWHIMLVNE